MATDIHAKTFDEGTQIKLQIVRDYLKQWLPVFIIKRDLVWKNIFIYDFFAGEGTDIAGNQGSPLIILDEIKKYCKAIQEKKIRVKIVMNEFNPKKTEKLRQSCIDYINLCKSTVQDKSLVCQNNQTCAFSLVVENQDFQNFFKSIYDGMLINPEYPRFIFLDQYGVKHVTEDIFNKFIALERTDFIFFISSSFVQRFIETPDFKKYINLSRTDFDGKNQYQCHRVLFEYYKSLVRLNKKRIYLAPFSIKKGKNVYGLVFGSHHKLGIEKFLKVCWTQNAQTGDANFDIDNQKINYEEPKLFPEQDIPKKIEVFEEELKRKIRAKELNSNIEVYDFAFDFGMLPIHANKILKELIAQGNVNKSLKLASSNIHKLVETELIYG